MGAVFKALHLRFNELRALKVISAQLASDANFINRFEKEAVLTRKLQHPNAVRVDDIDEAEDGRPFIVMEYIEGRSLKEPIQTEGALSVSRTCSIAKQVASALEAAHRLGIVHRDIKPENIVLVMRDLTPGAVPQEEVAKVLDFGIAKIKEAGVAHAGGRTLTETGVLIGSPPYMSPEQAMGLKGDQLDGRSDIYSLGIVMYQMLTGALPLKADTTMSMLMAQIQEPPIPFHDARPDLHFPESITSLVMRMLEKKPESRPQTAQAVIEAIESAERESTGLPGNIAAAPLGAALLNDNLPLGPTRKVISEHFPESIPSAAPAIQIKTPPQNQIPRRLPTAPAQEYSSVITAVPQKTFLQRHGVLIGIVVIALAIIGWRIHARQHEKTQLNTQAPGSQSVTADQGSFEKLHDRGEELMRQGDYSGAVVEFEQAVKLQPDDDEARMDLGRALEANGQKQKAYEELEVVCARNPDLSICTQDLLKLKKDLKETAPLP